MKHHLRLKKVIAFVLALTMTVTVLTSCEDKDESSSQAPDSSVSSSAEDSSSEAPDSTGGDQQEETEPEVTASAVKFMSSGKYTTTVTANKKDIDLSSLTKDNVEVTYIGLEKGTVLASDEEAEEEGTEEITGYTYSDGERIAVLDDIKQNSDGSYEISFTDENAVKYGVSEYNIRLKDSNGSIPVEVEFGEMSVTPDIKEVAPSATEVKITLELDGSEYADNVTTDMISLANAFYAMDIESVSASGKNLTVLLKGDITTNDSRGAYLFGTVIVAPEAVKDCASELRANVALLDSYVDFTASTLKFEGGKAAIDLKAYDHVDLNKLTKDNLKIDGVTVEKVEKKDDYTASVTLSVKDAKTGSDVVRALSGKEADFNGYKTHLTISPVSFYPVFDYCEASGDALKMGVILYAFGGRFGSELSTDAFSFGKELEGAKVESVKPSENGSSAELVITVPGNGQTSEAFSLEGDVTIAEGAITTAWGEKTDEALTCTRVFSNETIGKDWKDKIKYTFRWNGNMGGMNLNKNDLQSIQDWVKGKETWYGSMFWSFGVVGNIVSAFQGFMAFLEFVGLKESDQEKLMNELHDIKEMLKDIDAKLEKVRSTLNETLMKVYEDSLVNFDSLRSKFVLATENVQTAMSKAVTDLKAMNITLPENATVKQISVYNDQLMTYIYKRSGENYGQDPDYGSFKDDYKDMRNYFDELYKLWLSPSSVHNPFESYDKLYSMMYNFDTQSYSARFLLRETIRTSLIDAIPLMMIHDNITSDPSELPDTNNFKKAYNKLEEMCNFIDDNAVTGLASDELVFDDEVREVSEKYGETFISDIKVVGWGKSQECINMLSRQGYEIVNYDLNRNAGGKYIYLGYKTTKNYDEAIKTIRVLEGKDYGKKEKVTIDGKTYLRCPYDGDNTFKETWGDLNRKAGGADLYFFYSKEETDDKQAISGLIVNENKTNAVDGMDLNKKAGGADVYLHIYKSFGSGPIYIKDPQLVSGKSAAYKDGVYYADGKREGLDVDFCPAEGRDPLILSYERTDRYEDAVKDFLLIPGAVKESFEKGNATYKPVPYSSFEDSEFQTSKGNLNYANGGTEIHLYYTTDEVPKRGGVAYITADSDVSDSVSGKSVNMGAPNAPVTYLHLEKIDPESKHLVKKAAGDNPAYHPYCYVLGGTVRFFDDSNSSHKNMADFEKKALGLSAGRDWTDDEENDFIKRMRGKTFGDEMELAGMKIPEKCCIYTKLKDISYVKVYESIGGNREEIPSLKKYYYKEVKGNCLIASSKKLLVDHVAVKSCESNVYVREVKNGYGQEGDLYDESKGGWNDHWGILALD